VDHAMAMRHLLSIKLWKQLKIQLCCAIPFCLQVKAKVRSVRTTCLCDKACLWL